MCDIAMCEQREADSGLVMGDKKFLTIVLGFTTVALVALGVMCVENNVICYALWCVMYLCVI